jgi:putative FmdB family regulatory protein
MPKYIYKCRSCDVVLGLYHTMSDVVSDCPQCGAANALVKKPSSFNLEQNKQQEKKIGAVVKESIQDFKEDLETQKKEIQGQLYKEDE